MTEFPQKYVINTSLPTISIKEEVYYPVRKPLPQDCFVNVDTDNRNKNKKRKNKRRNVTPPTHLNMR